MMQSAESNLVGTPEVAEVRPDASTASIPIGPIVAALFLLFAVFVLTVHYAFPLFKPSDELMVPFPPDEIAVAREAAFQRGRLLNPLIALSCLAFLIAITLPLVLKSKGKTVPKMTTYLLPNAILCTVLAAIGVGLGHLVFELTTIEKLGITRTFVARWLEFAFFGAGVGAAVGAAVGGRNLAIEKALSTSMLAVLGALILDLVYVPIATAQVDALVPGGISWGNKNILALSLFAVSLAASLIFGLTNKGRKR